MYIKEYLNLNMKVVYGHKFRISDKSKILSYIEVFNSTSACIRLKILTAHNFQSYLYRAVVMVLKNWCVQSHRSNISWNFLEKFLGPKITETNLVP